MKKLLATTAIAMFGMVGVAMADTVAVTSQTSLRQPAANLSSSNAYAFKGTEYIIFEVAGKTCTLNGSAMGSVPMGCNYSITVKPDGSLVGELTAGNEVCTQTSAVVPQCK